MEFENPFTPSFGEIPAHMAGRRDIVASLERAFRSERRRPELTTLFSGARGMGKTSLMALLAHKAEALGWIAVSVTALPGMLADIESGRAVPLGIFFPSRRLGMSRASASHHWGACSLRATTRWKAIGAIV